MSCHKRFSSGKKKKKRQTGRKYYCSVHYYCPILTKTGTSRQTAVSGPTPNFIKSDSRVVTWGKTDMQKFRYRDIATFICESTRGEGIRLIHWKTKEM